MAANVILPVLGANSTPPHPLAGFEGYFEAGKREEGRGKEGKRWKGW